MRLIRQLRTASARATIGGPGAVLVKVVRSLRRGGRGDLFQILKNIWGSAAPSDSVARVQRDREEYRRWVKEFDTLTQARRLDLELAQRDFQARPRFSVLMPTHNTRLEWLIEAIESVRAQVYPDWELCIADDASREPHVADVLRTYAQVDARIRFVVRERNGHISATSNSALEMARGDWVALLDHDDILAPDALFWVAKAVNDHPQAQMVYSDEDKIDETGLREGAYFKPDWNPDLFLSQNMFSHLGVFRTDLVRAVGGFRVGLEGSQDYDLTLRCVERVPRAAIVHVPRILYHWRVHSESTAMSNEAKPYAMLAGQRAIEEHLGRRGIPAICTRVSAGLRVRYEIATPRPRVAIVISGDRAGVQDAAACAEAVLATTSYPEVHVFVVSGASAPSSDERITTILGEPGASRMGLALRQIHAGDFAAVCLMDVAIRPGGPEWLDELVSHAMRSEVGAVGPKILSPRGAVESGGIILIPGDPMRPADAHKGFEHDALGYGGRAQLAQQMPAVRCDCIVVKAALCVGLEELAEDPGIALCEKVWEQGLAVVWTPFSEVTATLPLRPLPGGVAFKALAGLDVAYNPNLSAAADFSLGSPPRLEWPSMFRTVSGSSVPVQP